jgi:hypothetical protein
LSAFALAPHSITVAIGRVTLKIPVNERYRDVTTVDGLRTLRFRADMTISSPDGWQQQKDECRNCANIEHARVQIHQLQNRRYTRSKAV